MLSIGKCRPGTEGAAYYADLSSEDYYIRGNAGEPPGQWCGEGARALGLTGTVSREDFCRLYDGYSAGKPLALNAGSDQRRPAFDLTYSAPKSASIARAIASQDLQRQMDQAMQTAVRAANDYMEQTACYTRLGAQGAQTVKGNGFTIATFQHLVSRELDPQWHVHSVVFNFTQGPDDEYRTLDGRKLYEHKMTAGAIFRAELSKQLEALGFQIERDRFSFRVVGIPQSLVDEFSKRSEQIRKALGGEAHAALKAKATLATREPKRDVDRNQLMEDWRGVAKEHGVTASTIEKVRHEPSRDWASELTAAIDAALARVGIPADDFGRNEIQRTGRSHFTEAEFLQFVAEESQGRGLSANDIRLGVWAELEHARRGASTSLVYLGTDQEGKERFSTREVYEFEQETLKTVEEGQSTIYRVNERAVLAAIQARPTIKEEQKEAVWHITQEPGSVKCVCGMAGTGKTYMLATAKEAWQKAGYRVAGTAIAGIAAKNLQDEAGIESNTVRKRLWDLDNPGANRFTLDHKSVLIVDEAGMVGTKDLHRLITKCHKAGAKLVLVGDDRQLQSIDAGGGFGSIARRYGFAELKEITRQRDDSDRKAVYDLAEGRAAPALRSYAERGRLHLADDKEAAMRMLVKTWRSDRRALDKRIVLTTTNHQAKTLNQMMQAERQAAGELGAVYIKSGDQKIYLNDRIILTERAARLRIENGMRGTLEAVNPLRDTVTIRLDDGERRTISLERYKQEHIKLSYATTTHKAQGMTTENAYIFAMGNMTDAQMGYVMASRARGETHIFTTKNEAGPDLEDLARSFSRDRRKTLAHDVERPRHEQKHHLKHRL